jgi:hypothetical protein
MQMTPAALLHQRWAIYKRGLVGAMVQIANSFEKTNLAPAWANWPYDAAGHHGTSASQQAQEGWHGAIKREGGIDTSRVSDAKFALDTCPQIIRWSGIRFSGGIRRAIQFTGLPNDPACIEKAGLLIKHAALWVLRDKAGYFNSRRVLGDRFLKEKVTEDRIRIWEASRQNNELRLPNGQQPTLEVSKKNLN